MGSNMKKSVLLASALALASLSSSAVAADGAGTWFVRGEAGRTEMDIEGLDASDDAYGARAGYFFNPNFAVEGFYTNYADDSEDGVSAKLSGFGVGVIGKKNFGPNVHTGFFINGRVGVARVETKLAVVEVGSVKESATKGYVGVGTGYDFSPNLGLSLNYDYTKTDTFGLDIKLETLTLGLEYRF